MSRNRFLFVVPPLTGHCTPLVAVARRLAAAGTGVVWCGDPHLVRSLAGPDAVVHPCPDRPFVVDRGGEGLRGYAAVRYLWESVFVPLADASVAPVAEAAARYEPDAMLCDMQALAGPLVAARLGLPWATSATTSGPLRDSFAATPKVRAWLDGLLSGLIDRHLGTHDLGPRELELSPRLVIAFTTRALAGADGFPSQVRFVGPALAEGSGAGPAFPWERLDGRPLVVVTLGTVNAGVGARFLGACLEALGLLGGRVQAVIADPLGALGDTEPPGVIIRPYLPIVELAARASAVICHGGHNTVCETLAHGVPLVVAPIRDDQPVIAEQVVEAGAGVRLRFGRATPEIIRDAVLAVLDDPRYAAGARAVEASFAAAGSADAAAHHLLSLVRPAAVPGAQAARSDLRPVPGVDAVTLPGAVRR